MIPQINHSWQPTYQEALDVQRWLKERLVLDTSLNKVDLIAGADVSYEKAGDLIYAGVIVFSYPLLEVVERVYTVAKSTFPYIPGLLTFREGPALISAFSRLKHEPDVLVFDGQGIAHPRRLGIAAHMGILFDKPSIGCAKKRLCGDYVEPDKRQGSYSLLRLDREDIGVVLRSREKVKPVFVSPGYRISLEQSMAIILNCCRGYRLPEVVRLPHLYVNDLRLQDRQKPVVL